MAEQRTIPLYPSAKPQSRLDYLLTQSWPARTVQSLVAAAALPGDVYAGRVDPTSQEAIDRSADLAGALVGGPGPAAAARGAAPAGEMALGTFAGARSLTADKMARAWATGMQEAGASRTAIFNETGWFPGREGALRYEISDHGAAIRPGAMVRVDAGRTLPLRDILDHPDLYSAYPQLGEMPVAPLPADSPFAGLFHGNRIETRGAPDIKETLLHEAQHAVQDYEGFAPGIHPDDAFSDVIYRHSQALKNAVAGYEAGTVPETEIRRGYQIAQELQRRKKDVADEAYRRTAGETEARNVEYRMNMTPVERADNVPWRTQDVPYTKQTIPTWHTLPGILGGGR